MSIVSLLHHPLHFSDTPGTAPVPLMRHIKAQVRHLSRFRPRRDRALEIAMSPAILSSGHIVQNVFFRRQP